MIRWALIAVLLPALAFAAKVGTVTALKGTAFRIANGAGLEAEPPSMADQPLKVGSDFELKDRIEVGQGSFAKLTLNDGSVLALGPSSVLDVNAAQFKDQVREGFSAKLWLGSLWSHVTHALSGGSGKFEVSTDRAVAGVRGTIFRVDATPVAAGSFPPKLKETVVKVTEGRVAVAGKVKPKKGKPEVARHEVAGPQEITKDEWERRFVLLKAHREVRVGEDYWKVADYDPGKQDALDSFATGGAQTP